jgi:hypothetical protein
VWRPRRSDGPERPHHERKAGVAWPAGQSLGGCRGSIGLAPGFGGGANLELQIKGTEKPENYTKYVCTVHTYLASLLFSYCSFGQEVDCMYIHRYLPGYVVSISLSWKKRKW